MNFTGMTNNRNVFDIADSSAVLTAGNIKSVNESINTSEIIEENERAVNDIFLSIIGQNQIQINQNSIDQLEYVASQCPLAGGNAVYRARALLSLIGDNYDFDDVNICLQAGIILRQKSEIQSIAALYPNPASSSATLTYNLAENTQADFQLFNSIGQLHQSYLLYSEKSYLTFSTETFKPGVYHYRLITNSGNQLYGKLIIIHKK